MKEVQVTNRGIPSKPRSQYYTAKASTVITSSGSDIDLSKYMLISRWLENFEEKVDASGNPYLLAKKSIAVVGGVTMYASDGASVPSIFDGIPLDNKTIHKNPDTGLIEVIGGTGSSFDENAMWSALAGSSENQINKSHLTTALTGYATESWVSQSYATTEALKSVSDKLNDFLEGSDTDNIINKWKELEAFLSGMAETDNLAEILGTKADRSYVDSTFVTLATKQTITGEKTFSSVLNTADIKASGEITTPSLAASDYVTIAGIKLRKLEDGALMLEGNLALTGGLTMYASDGVSFPSIYDGLPIDNDTIYWETVEGSKVLKAKEGSGSSFDKSAMWTALAGGTTEQINKSHLTTALTGYATESWVTGKNYAVKATTLAGYGITDGINAVSVTGTGNAVTAASISGHTLTLTKGSTFSLSGHKHAWSDITSGKPTTLSGYGITDAYTKTDADSRYVNVSGDTMTGDLFIQKTERTDKLYLFHSTEENKCGISLIDKEGEFHTLKLTTSDLTWKGNNIWHAGNDGSGSGLDADLLDGTHKTGLLTALSTSSATNLSITVGGTTKTITDLYAYASTKLETARTLWGQSFDGTKNVSGDLTSVGNITGSGTFSSANTKVSDSVYINGIRLHKTQDGVITLEGNLAVTGGVTMYAVDPVTIPTIMDGIACDNTTIRVNPDTGVLEVLAASGEAGSVQWGNISGKPSWIGDTKPSYSWTEISGKPSTFTPSSHVHAISEVTNLQTTLNAKVSSVEVTGTGNAITAASITSGKLTLTKGATYNNYSLPLASSTTRGGVKIGYAENGKNYPVELSNEQMFVNVPWTDTKYTLGSFGITATADEINKLDGCTATTAELNYVHGVTSAIQDQLDNKLESSAYTAADVLTKLKTVDGSNSGLDADLLDGTHKTGLFTALTSSSATNISITVGGTTKSIADLYANSAAKLETARTLWGQSFDGTKNITGALTSVTDITGTGTFTGANLKATDSVYVNGIRLHKTADGVITLEGNLAVTGGVTMYAIDPVSASTVMDGVAVDGTTIAKVDGVLKVLNAGGGEAGSVAWGNITGKPSVYATNIANITDLHANWDALLKSAPSAYVTRWPTISEVTSKQNLVVKLNGGTTEGTNQFTYNVTGEKTINITPAGIGAATSGHTHAMSAITDLHSSWDALLKAAPSSYVTRWPSFAEVTSKPTTLAGYGITDAPTKTGSGASGTWGINISGTASNADKLDNIHLSGIVHSEQGYSTGTTEASGSSRNLSRSGFWRDNNRARIGIFACHALDSNYGWELSCGYDSVRPYFSVKSNGSWKSDRTIAFIDDNVSSANQLANTRTLWGQNFNGTQNVSGDLTGVGKIKYPNGEYFDEYGNMHLTTSLEKNYWTVFNSNGAELIKVNGIGGIIGSAFKADNWYRSTGNTGWQNETYSGGWYMQDSSYIRSYNNKSIHIGSGSYITANGGYKVNIDANTSEVWNCRYIVESLSVPAGNVRNILGWYDSSSSGYTTSYIIGSKREAGNNWGELMLGVYQYEGTNRSVRLYMGLDGAGGRVYIGGNLLVTGGVTLYGSDIRYKSIMQQVKLSLSEIAKAPSFVYHWNKKGMKCDRLNLGGSAQYTQSILPWAVEENDNFLSMDYATVAYTFAVHTARHLLTYETRTDKKIKKLENRVKYLEKQLKKLGYEEANIVDDQSV